MADPYEGWTEEPAATAEASSQDEFAGWTEETPEDLETEKNTRLQSIFSASFKEQPDRKAGVLKLAREAQLPTSVVEQRYDDFQSSWEAAQSDPAEWRAENPELAKLALEHPELGTVVVRDQQLSVLSKALNSYKEFWRDVYDGQRSWLEPLMPGQYTPEKVAEAEATLAPTLPKKEAVTQDGKTEALGKMGWQGDIAIPVIRFRETMEQLKVSQMQFELLTARAMGSDTYELEKKIQDAKLGTVRRDYGEGPLGQLATDVAEATASQVAVLKDAGAGAAAGAVVGGAAGALITRTPGGALSGAGRGASILGKVGLAAGSLRLEAGSAYGELLEARTDDGRPLTEEEARGGALVYGGIAAAIELASSQQLLKALGPLGTMIRTGSRKAAVAELMKDAGFREIAKRAGREWLKSGVSEGLEEAAQSSVEDAVTYLTRSKAAGQLQGGPVVDVEKALVSAEKGTIGGLGMGAGTSSVHVATQMIARDRAVTAGRQVAALAGVAESPTVKAAPEAVAQMIAQATESTGEKVTHLYVDPEAFTRLFQGENGDPAQAAAQMLGPDGPRVLQEAIATGSKLEVPLAEYLEKWGTSGVAAKLTEDTTTLPGHLTPRQLATQEKEVDARAKELAKEYESENSTPSGVSEKALVEGLEKQLVATGSHTAKEARAATAPIRAFIRTQAETFGLDAEQLFADMAVEVQKGDDASAAPAEALAQEEVLDIPEASKLLTARAEGAAALTPEGRASELYRDPVSGLGNRRAWDEAAKPKGKMVAVITSPDVKAINDDPQGGHDTANALLRTIGTAVAQVDPSAARSGTNFLLHVSNDAELSAALEKVKAVLPDAGLTVEGAVGYTLDKAFSKLDRSTAEKREAGRLPARGKTAMDLAKLPGLQFAADPASVALPGELVERAGSLPAEDFFAEAYQDKTVPGLLSATGWNAIPRKKFVASLDLKGLKLINDTLGKEAGDQVLELFGKTAAGIGGSAFDFAHLSGDEYAAQANDSAELEAFLADLKATLQDVSAEHTLPNGERVGLNASFRHGIGEGSYGAADRVLNEAKRRETASPNDVRGVRGSPGETSGTARREDRGGDVQGRGDLEARATRLTRRGSRPQAFGNRSSQKERLNQNTAAGTPRGYTEMAREGVRRLFKIALNKNADLSTFLHESGHVFLEVFGDLAAREDAPATVREDFAATLKWMGVETRQGIKRDHHEKWARSFEAYLMEGKAPSAKLVAAFERFRLWLRNIYRTFSSLNADLNDEIRGVFDRLLATDAEIQRTKRAMGLKPLFASPAEAGMAPEQWQTYLQEQEQATSHATRAAELRALKDKLRETEGWWKAEEAKQREDAEREFDGLPVVRADRYIRTGDLTGGDAVLLSSEGPQKLDRKAVGYLLGREPAGLGAMLKADGVHPDDVAELFGFATGRALLEDLERKPERDAWVKQRAKEAMGEKYPDILSERAKLRELVSKGLHGDFTAKWLLREWQALKSKAGGVAAPVESIKRAAKLIVERRPVGNINLGATLQAERSAAEKSAKAAAKGNFPQAAVFKQQQLLNFYLSKELADARDARDAFEKLASDLTQDKARARLGKGSPVYRDGVDLVLESLGLKDEDASREQPLPSIGEVVSAMEADGTTVMFDTEAVNRLLAKARDWKTLSVADLREVDAALKNIRAAARAKSTALVDDKRVEKEEVISQLLKEANENLPSLGKFTSSESAKTSLQKLGGVVSALDGELLKPELMADWLAGGNLKATWFRAIIKPLQDAKVREYDLLNKTVKPIVEAFEKMPSEVRSRFMESVDGAKLFPGHRTDVAAPTRRFELLMMALNSGNESNLQRLLEGRNITEAQLTEALNLLTKEEMDWVQSVWDAADSLWPESSALEERDSGLAPEKIKARPLATRHGAFRGGYFPAVYDRRVEVTGERQAANTIASLMDPSFTRPGTAKGHLKGRVDGFTGALSLEPNAIGTHLAQVAHDIAFREAMKSVGGLIMNPEIQAAMKERLGDERAKQFLPWLKDIGSMRGAEGSTRAGKLTGLLRWARGNTVLAVLGYSLPTALGDISNLLAAVPGTELKAKHWAAGLAQFMASPLRSAEEAEAKSGELRTRRDSLQRELTKQVNTLTATGPLSRGPLKWVKDHAFVFMEASDRFTSTPIWMGAYRQAIADDLSESDAVTYADRIIRQLFPSHSAVDASAILRDKGAVGAMLMFHGFFNQVYNRNRDILHELHTAEDFAEAAKRVPRVGARLLAFAFATSVASEILSGRGKDDDEDRGLWMLRKLLVGWSANLPLVGDIGAGLEAFAVGKRSNPRASPLVDAINAVGSAVMALNSDDKELDQKIWAVMRAAGPLTGLPVTQLKRTAGYLTDVARGDAVPRDPFDFASGVVYGEREGQPENLLRDLSDAISGGR